MTEKARMTLDAAQLKVTRTERGFEIGTFVDDYGQACSLQQSSNAERDCLWLGCDEGQHIEGRCLARMHLTTDHARMLIKHMRAWLTTGSIAAARASGGEGRPERVCRAVTSDGWCLCEPDDEGDCSTCGETASTTHACPEGFRRSTPSPDADVVGELVTALKDADNLLFRVGIPDDLWDSGEWKRRRIYHGTILKKFAAYASPTAEGEA